VTAMADHSGGHADGPGAIRVTQEPCLFVGPDLARTGGAAYHMRQIFRWICTPSVTFATFGSSVPPDVAKRVARVVHIEKQKWTGYPAAISRLASLLRETRPAATLAFGMQPLLAAWAAFRLIGHRRGLGYIEITRPWKAFNTSGWGPRTYANDWLLRRSLARCDIVTANCTDGVEELRTHFHVPAAISRRVHNLLDFSEFPPGKSDYRITGPARLVTTSRLVPDKGLEDLIEAVARLATRHDVHLTIVGDGPLRGTLERLAQSNAVADRVFFSGWANPPFAHITAADLFVFPSHYEGFPNSVLEPMGLGVPVVTSFWGTDARELAAAGAVLGHEPGDVGGLCHQIETALEQEHLRRNLAEKARACAAQYDSRTAALEYDLLFAELAAIGASRAGATGA
jgi:glycosyltransferase involved in cell wall biosynthesis